MRSALLLSTNLIFAFLLSTSCATTRSNPDLPDLISEHQYYSDISAYTGHQQVYDGLYEILDFYATLLNSKVSRSQLDQNARIYQWSKDQYDNKKSEMETNLSKQTEVFLSFFVPERKHDDLNKNYTTWRVFLDNNGKRYEGKIDKIKTILAEVQERYPHHTRFHTPYHIVFPVPVSQIENTESKLTVTGPVTSASVTLPALKP